MICRLCLTDLKLANSVALFNEFDSDDDPQLLTIIAKYLDLKITWDDEVSTTICSECCKHLSEFEKYCLSIREQQIKLSQKVPAVGDKCEPNENFVKKEIKVQCDPDEDIVTNEMQLECESNEDIVGEEMQLQFESEIDNVTEMDLQIIPDSLHQSSDNCSASSSYSEPSSSKLFHQAYKKYIEDSSMSYSLDSGERVESIPDANSIKELEPVQDIYQHYLLRNALCTRDRLIIAQSVIDACLKNTPEKKLVREDFEKLAENIKEVFPTEIVYTYYSPPVLYQLARGKLWSVYISKKRQPTNMRGEIKRRSREYFNAKTQRKTVNSVCQFNRINSMSSESQILQKKKRKTFNNSWKIEYMCRDHDGESQCLLCERHLFSRASNLKRHYDTMHGSEFKKYEGEARKTLYEELISGFEVKKLEENFSNTDSVRVSYEIVLCLVRGNHAFYDSDFIKICILKAVAILSKKELPKYEAISLSRSTISRQLQDMAEDSEQQLKERINSFVAVSLALDESTDVTDITQLAVFIRGVDSEFNVTEELLDIIAMKGTTTAADIFKCIDDCVVLLGLPWKKVVCIATDGAQAMTEHKTGFIARLRQKFRSENLNDFVAIHCLIHHEEALCANSFSLNNVMDVVVECVNMVRVHGLSHGEFKDFLEVCEQEHTNIPYFYEIRCLSRGITLKRFFELRSQIYEFLAKKGKPYPILLDPEWITDLAFMTDITQHLNTLYFALLERDKLIYKMSDEIEGFKRKLALWRRQLEEKKFYHFPCLQMNAENQVINVTKFCNEILNLEKEFAERFSELFSIKNKLEVFVNPFAIDPYNAPSELQIELLKLQCDTQERNNYKELTSSNNFYKKLCVLKYPKIREFAINIIAMFGSIYCCELFYSTMKLNKTCLRNHLQDVNMKAFLRLSTAQEIQPNINEIVLNKRCQLSS